MLLIVAGALSGALGALLGIGGGVLMMPVLVLGFQVPLEQAVPASLMCVVASSCAATARFVESRLSDIRLGLTLELATVVGAIVGGRMASRVAPATLALVFGLFCLYVAAHLFTHRPVAEPPGGAGDYVPRNYALGLSGSFVAGGLSALLGVGGGPLKVPLMSYGMRVPFKVASATSNLTVGITGAASVATYAWGGQMQLGLVAPLVVGVLAGASTGSRLMPRVRTASLQWLLALVLVVVAGQMLWKGGMGLWPTLWQ